MVVDINRALVGDGGMTGSPIQAPKENQSDAAVAHSAKVARLPESYARWRASRLGRITDALETDLILDLLGPITHLEILDVGCGDGTLALELARRGANITGLDADPDMVAAARRKADEESPRTLFVEGRAERLPFGDATFDRVVAVTVLCFVHDAKHAMAEIARVLKPGGRLVIGELGRWSLWAMQRRIRGWLGSRTWRLARFRTAAQLRRLVSSVGLRPLVTRGSVFYPPIVLAAQFIAPVDPRLGRSTTFGAAFIALSALKQ